MYGKSYCCPPDTPTPDQMRQVLGSYQRAILFHFQSARISGHSRKKSFSDFISALVDLEGEMFRDGYYKVLVLLAGPCGLCEQCARTRGEPCALRSRARPSMEACGIDVYATARGNGFHIQPLREKGETQNDYCLMLVD
jgi:predicted metal-binding protein